MRWLQNHSCCNFIFSATASQTSQNAFHHNWAMASSHFARLPRLARKSKISLRNSFVTISITDFFPKKSFNRRQTVDIENN